MTLLAVLGTVFRDVAVKTLAMQPFVSLLPVMAHRAFFLPRIIVMFVMTVDAGEALVRVGFMGHGDRSHLTFIWGNAIILCSIFCRFGYHDIVGIVGVFVACFPGIAAAGNCKSHKQKK